SHGLWHGYTDIEGSGGVGEWLTRIMARIYGYRRKWGSRGVAHTDYGTDIRISKEVGKIK
ncbi:hypothetical protein, partial [Okeania sp. SIO3B5]|uniref:hypothetical protein n=1 Tax=Okeania sp. SIO3B5 TaxID=2607811 RepID=UPI0025F5EA7D